MGYGLANSRIAMAMIVALALTACSDGGDVAIASPEEQAGQDELNDITVQGHATLPSAASGIARSESLRRTAANGSVVRMSELDSVTLDTTGVFYYSRCDGSTGEFSFDGVTLRSPYVKLELAPYQDEEDWNGAWSFDVFDADMDRYVVEYSAIVDLRESKNVDVNAFTYLVSYRVRHLVNLGYGTAEAKSQAEREILDAVGLSGELYNFDKREFVNDRKHLIANKVMDSLIYEWSANASPLLVANSFGYRGTFASVNMIKEFFVDEMKKWRSVYSVHDDTVGFIDGFIATLYGFEK